jgi:hypothetical protein
MGGLQQIDCHMTHIPALSPSCSIALSPYRLIARTGGAKYDNPEGGRRWAICVKSATYQGGLFEPWKNMEGAFNSIFFL